MHASEAKPLLGTPLPASDPQPVKTFDAGILGSDEYGALTGFASGEIDQPDFGAAHTIVGWHWHRCEGTRR